MTRPSWDVYLMQLAMYAAKRGTCSRLQVGCVLATPDNRVFSTGMNGVAAGQPHCEHDPQSNAGCTKAIHAERNAVLWALQNCHHLLPGSTAYVTCSPCQRCAELLAMAEVSRVVYAVRYRIAEPLDYLARVGVKVEQSRQE